MSYLLAAIDLDATLLNGSGRISDVNAAALRRLSERGVVVAPATARWYQAAVSQFNALGLTVAAIASSGADVRLADGTIVAQRECPAGFGPFIAELCDRAGWPANVSTKSRTFRRERSLPEWASRAPEWITPVTDLAGADLDHVLSVLATVPPNDAHAAELERWVGRIALHHAIAFTGETLLTITAAGADKGSGLMALCAALGIDPGDAVAFGDSDVDLPMFGVAGLTVAMANGSQAVRDGAGMVTGTADEDGVAQAIARIWG